VLFGGLVVWSGRNRIDVSHINEEAILSASKKSGNIADHVFGKQDSKVRLIEYGDFQCPGCGAAHPRVKTLMDKYQDKMAFVFRNYPLTNLHPNARAAAAAVEAAGLLGKYWPMHNLVFDNQSQWSDASADARTDFFAGYAQQVGLSRAKFLSLLNDKSARLNQKISFDQALGRKLKITGTPTFYLNGKQLTENQFGTDDAFDKTITDALARNGIKVDTETKKSDK
jgi:protein-disulfide isomerase